MVYKSAGRLETFEKLKCIVTQIGPYASMHEFALNFVF